MHDGTCVHFFVSNFAALVDHFRQDNLSRSFHRIERKRIVGLQCRNVRFSCSPLQSPKKKWRGWFSLESSISRSLPSLFWRFWRRLQEGFNRRKHIQKRFGRDRDRIESCIPPSKFRFLRHFFCRPTCVLNHMCWIIFLLSRDTCFV